MVPLIALAGAACVTTTPSRTSPAATPSSAISASASPASASTRIVMSVPASLRPRLLARIAEVPGARVGLYLHDLATNETLGIDDTVTFHAASTMKVPVMVELMRQADTAALTLDARTPLVNTFASILDGSPYHLSRDGDSDPTLYDRVGAPITYRELNERMIVRSSNLATNVLIERLDPARITATARALGGEGIVVRRGVEDQKAFEADRNNVTTARGLGRLLTAIERGEAASAWATAAMRATLLRQEFNDEIPAGLPVGIPVAHKTGWITATTHDAAIIYPRDRAPLVLVILTRAIPDRATAQRLIADLTRLIWNSCVTDATPRCTG
jgi:beta-lactamase class A